MRRRTRTICSPLSCDLPGRAPPLPPPCLARMDLWGGRDKGGFSSSSWGAPRAGGGFPEEEGGEQGKNPFPSPTSPRALLLWRAARARGFAAGNETEAGLIPGSRPGGAAPGSPPLSWDRGTPPRRGGGARFTGCQAAIPGEGPNWVTVPPSPRTPGSDPKTGDPKSQRGWWW